MYVHYMDICLIICLYVSCSVELESLGPLLGQVVVALSPLVNMFPEQIAGIFQFFIIENRYICTYIECVVVHS